MFLIKGATRHKGFVIGAAIRVHIAIRETHLVVGLYALPHFPELHSRTVNGSQVFHHLAQKDTTQRGEGVDIPLERVLADFLIERG